MREVDEKSQYIRALWEGASKVHELCSRTRLTLSKRREIMIPSHLRVLYNPAIESFRKAVAKVFTFIFRYYAFPCFQDTCKRKGE